MSLSHVLLPLGHVLKTPFCNHSYVSGNSDAWSSMIDGINACQKFQIAVSPDCFIEWRWFFACGHHLSQCPTYVNEIVFGRVSEDGEIGHVRSSAAVSMTVARVYVKHTLLSS